MHLHIIKYVYSFHRKRISVPHFVGVYGYEGAINRSPTAANGLPQRCWRIGIIWRTLRKISTFNHEIPNEHSQKHPTYTPQNINEHPQNTQLTPRQA